MAELKFIIYRLRIYKFHNVAFYCFENKPRRVSKSIDNKIKKN